MKILFALLGVLLGFAEFFLTKAISVRALNGKKFLPILGLKMLSYGVILLVAYLLWKHGYTIVYGVGLGAGVLASALLYFIYNIIKEKR